MQSPEEIDEIIGKLTSPKPSPASAIQDPSRRRTEIYLREERLEEHIKLRKDEDIELRSIEKLRREEEERTNEQTEEKVNELIAAHAATQETMAETQATMAALAAENTSIKALLTQLVQLQTKEHSENDKNEPTKTDHSKPTTEPTTEPITDQHTDLNTELSTEMKRMGVLPHSSSTVTNSHDLPVTALITELENENVLHYTDFLQHCDTDQRRTVDPFSLYRYYKANDQGDVLEKIETLFKENTSATAYKAATKTLLEELKNFSNPAEHTRIMVFVRALFF